MDIETLREVQRRLIKGRRSEITSFDVATLNEVIVLIAEMMLEGEKEKKECICGASQQEQGLTLREKRETVAEELYNKWKHADPSRINQILGQSEWTGIADDLWSRSVSIRNNEGVRVGWIFQVVFNPESPQMKEMRVY